MDADSRGRWGDGLHRIILFCFLVAAALSVAAATRGHVAASSAPATTLPGAVEAGSRGTDEGAPAGPLGLDIVDCASTSDPCTFMGRLRLKQRGDSRGNEYQLAGHFEGQLLGIFSASPKRTEILLSAQSGELDFNRAVSFKYVPGETGSALGKLEIGQLSTAQSKPFTHGVTALRTNGLERLVIDAQGNVGIGTSSPKGKLHVAGVEYGASPVLIESPAAASVGASVNLDATPGGGRQFALLSTGSKASAGGGLFSVFDVAANLHRLTVNATGDVTVDGGKLRVRSACPACLPPSSSAVEVTGTGGVSASGLAPGGGPRPLTLSGSGGTILQPGGGNVGVGTANPQSNLHVVGRSMFTRVAVETQDALGTASVSFRLAGADQWEVGTVGGRDDFYVADVQDGGSFYRLFIPGAGPARGRVGIGTTTPKAELDVFGTTRTHVLEITGGADLAEPFQVGAQASVRPGMVVAIDPAAPGALRIADLPYDRTVAGVVSGAKGIRSGMVMRQEGSAAEGDLPVALTGRVYAWADASYGAIEPGDLLTTSGTPGHAMKVTDHAKAQGAILGKAMSRLEKGTGLVLVLVSLQ